MQCASSFHKTRRIGLAKTLLQGDGSNSPPDLFLRNTLQKLDPRYITDNRDLTGASLTDYLKNPTQHFKGFN